MLSRDKHETTHLIAGSTGTGPIPRRCHHLLMPRRPIRDLDVHDNKKVQEEPKYYVAMAVFLSLRKAKQICRRQTFQWLQQYGGCPKATPTWGIHHIYCRHSRRRRRRCPERTSPSLIEALAICTNKGFHFHPQRMGGCLLLERAGQRRNLPVVAEGRCSHHPCKRRPRRTHSVGIERFLGMFRKCVLLRHPSRNLGSSTSQSNSPRNTKLAFGNEACRSSGERIWRR
mmetsp:Transcript_10020/g.18272  ORF Transcript_10020/g.18272 Transcript_10020/m.18272 type:complete len:228 (-) Transcript_10020:593-1276(-)